MTGDEAADLVEVRLLRMPVGHHHRTAQHVDELLREFTFLDGEADDAPKQLLDLRDDMDARFSGFTAGSNAQFEEAHAAGLDAIDITLRIPRVAGPLSAQALELLDRADAFCAAGDHLLTLAAPPEVVAYRRWFFGEFVRQCDGEPPAPWPGPA